MTMKELIEVLNEFKILLKDIETTPAYSYEEGQYLNGKAMGVECCINKIEEKIRQLEN
jgi:hypothetical protein